MQQISLFNSELNTADKFEAVSMLDSTEKKIIYVVSVITPHGQLLTKNWVNYRATVAEKAAIIVNWGCFAVHWLTFTN